MTPLRRRRPLLVCLSVGLDQRHHLGFAPPLSGLKGGFAIFSGNAEISLGIQENLVNVGEGEANRKHYKKITESGSTKF